MGFKQIFSICLVLLSLSACHNEAGMVNSSTDTTARKPAPDYAFKAKHSLNWQKGDDNNAAMLLNCLKKYVAGDVAGCGEYFADTTEWISDKFRFRGSRDSLMAIMANVRSESAGVEKNFDSWITTYYPDQDETCVTLWYTEIMTDKKGKVDSIYYTDDVMIKNQKIYIYDEKQRKFPPADSK